jgi:hypothetical protein
MKRTVLAAAAIALSFCGCSFAPRIKQSEQAPENFVERTRILAEVTGTYTRTQILQPKQSWTGVETWHARMLSVGFTDADIVDGSEVSASTYCYAHNSNVGCRHQGLYFAHVPSALQGQLSARWENGVQVRQHGDIVEIELQQTPSNDLVGVVVAVYRKYDSWASCRWERLNYEGFVPSPFGSPIGMWLDCDELEKEGWQKRRVAHAPPPGPLNAPDRFIHEWIKLPGASPMS